MLDVPGRRGNADNEENARRLRSTAVAVSASDSMPCGGAVLHGGPANAHVHGCPLRLRHGVRRIRRPAKGKGKGASKATEAWRRSGGIAVIRNFLPPDEHARVVAEVKAASKSLKPETNSLAVGRSVAPLFASDSAVVELFGEAASSTAQHISRVVGRELVSAPLADFPPELRVYRKGARMEWHRDDLIYATPQVRK